MCSIQQIRLAIHQSFNFPIAQSLFKSSLWFQHKSASFHSAIKTEVLCACTFNGACNFIYFHCAVHRFSAVYKLNEAFVASVEMSAWKSFSNLIKVNEVFGAAFRVAGTYLNCY